MKKSLMTALLVSMLVFAGNAMAAPSFSVSDVSGIWDDNGTPGNYLDDLITVEFDAYPSAGWTLDSTTVWVFEPYSLDPLDGYWSPLHDTNRGTFLAEELTTDPITGAIHYRMLADAVGFGAPWGSTWDLSNVYEPQGFFIDYWDGNGDPDAQWGDPDFPEYYKVLADGAISLHSGMEGAEIYPGSSSPSWAFVPEPASLLLLGSGFLGLGFWKKKENLKA